MQREKSSKESQEARLHDSGQIGLCIIVRTASLQ